MDTEGPHAEGVDKGDIGVDAKDVNEVLMPKFWCRQVAVVTKDIDEDMLSVLTSKMLEKPL